MAGFATKSSLAAACLLALMPQIGQAREVGGVLDRLEGRWSGKGTIQRNLDASPTRVSCDMTGDASSGGFDLKGACRAAIFTRPVGASLRRSGNGYIGSYVGSRIGPASLSGRPTGDAVSLAIVWPREVNGDRNATMTIQSLGPDRFRITVTDRSPTTGRQVRTTDLTFTRR